MNKKLYTKVQKDAEGADSTQSAGYGEEMVGAQYGTSSTFSVGEFVRWNSSGGAAQGEIVRIVKNGTISPPRSSFTITGTNDDPAALIKIYRPEADGYWSATDTMVAHKCSTLSKIDPLPIRHMKSYTKWNPELTIHVKFESPNWLIENVKRGLAWYEQGKGGGGLTSQTVREARQMVSGFIPDSKIIRMNAWFARHMVDLDADAADPSHENFPSPGVVAHALWGGGTKAQSQRAWDWVKSRVDEAKSK